MRITIDDGHSLPDPERAEFLAWLDRIAPDRWALDVIVNDDHCVIECTGPGTRTNPDLVEVADGDLVTHEVTTTEQPPASVMAWFTRSALRDPARDTVPALSRSRDSVRSSDKP